MKINGTKPDSHTRWMVIFSLVFSGEMIFSLPFHVARFFRPALLDVFNLTNTRLGDVLAVYGITAMVSYFPGGVLADRFSARNLMTVSLSATALGGIYFARIPGALGLTVLFGFWGATTILMFWAALIKVTRAWGGRFAQGKAFGLLDGGRGLVAAGAATLAVMLFSRFLPDVPADAGIVQRTNALRAVIYYYTVLTFAAALMAWFFIPGMEIKKSGPPANLARDIGDVLHNRLVWLQAIIVVSAYCGYKGLDYYSLYATNVLGMDEVHAAWFVSNSAYIRAFAAISAGLLVDRFSAGKVLGFVFGFLLIDYIFLGMTSPVSTSVNIILGNMVLTFAAVYALRGVYFALLEETGIKKVLTGTAVGLISVIGYTPDAFFNSLAGRVLDAAPGEKGFQHFYLLLALFGLTGLTATFLLLRKNKIRQEVSR